MAKQIFGEKEINFIEYPMNEGSGTVAQAQGLVLAINRVSPNQEEAWEFLSWLASPECQEDLPYGLPINQRVLEENLRKASEIEYEENAEGVQQEVVKVTHRFEGEEPTEIYCISLEEGKELMKLIENVSMSNHPNEDLRGIVFDEVDYYFSGDKSLDEVAEVIQSRASLYVREKTN